jgi:hypothetical protein
MEKTKRYERSFIWQGFRKKSTMAKAWSIDEIERRKHGDFTTESQNVMKRNSIDYTQSLWKLS